MTKKKTTKTQPNSKPAGPVPAAINVRVRPTMYRWLESQISPDLISVPEVVRDCVEKQMKKEGG